MKLVYTHPDPILVAHMRSSIELAGIECVLRNEYASGAVGELAPLDTWVEVWVLRDRDCERARGIIESLQREPEEDDWTCQQCASACPSTFETCWHCGAER